MAPLKKRATKAIYKISSIKVKPFEVRNFEFFEEDIPVFQVRSLEFKVRNFKYFILVSATAASSAVGFVLAVAITAWIIIVAGSST